MASSQAFCDAFIKTINQKPQSKFCMYGDIFRDLLQKIFVDDNRTSTVHPYQIKAVFKVAKMLTNDQKNNALTQPALIVAPTGAGKSGMIAMLPYVLQSKKVLILTPSAIISYQLAEAFGWRQDKKNCFLLESKIFENAQELEAFLEDVKVISNATDAMQHNTGNLVIVNAQKFGGKAKTTLSMEYRDEVIIEDVKTFFAQFDTLIVDEAHHYPAATWRRIVDEFKEASNGVRKKIVFLTATPCKTVMLRRNTPETIWVVEEKRIAYRIQKEMCIGSSIRKLRFEINLTDHQKYIYHIRTRLDKQYEIENRYKPQAMVLAKGRKEVNDIVKELNYSCGPDYAVAISGQTKKIAENLKDFTEGKYRVAVTCKVGLEGYDNTNVTLCVIMRKIVTGKIMFSQFVGRCMRIRRGLGHVNGEEKTDRNEGIVLSYKIFDQEKLRKEYESMDEITGEDPDDREEVADDLSGMNE